MKKFVRAGAFALSLALVGTTATFTALAADSAAPKTEKKSESSGEPGIRFATTAHNFGIVKEKGGPVSYSFEFTNTGTKPLVIISATASCGCTRPQYPTEPIAPGKKGKIKVTYLPEGRPGEFTRIVKVRTNIKDAKKLNLTIKGTVQP